MKIGNINFDGNLVLAPMAGVTDKAFRQLCKFFGASLTVTEMISVKALLHKNKKTMELLETFPCEFPCAVQIFGHDPRDFEKVIESGVLDKFDIIDINMGCPAPKIVKNGDGSALLLNLPLARDIISSCVRKTTKPVSVKFRKGFDENHDILVPFAKMCEEAGASAITIHPRTKEQGYSGDIDINDIKRIKKSVKIPVIGNGNVVDKASYDKMLETGCDGVMIGRRAVGHPEIFAELSGKDVTMTKLEIARKHLDIMKKYYKNDYILNTFKRHAFSYVGGEDGAVEKRKKLALCATLPELEQILFENA